MAPEIVDLVVAEHMAVILRAHPVDPRHEAAVLQGTGGEIDVPHILVRMGKALGQRISSAPDRARMRETSGKPPS